MRYLDRVSFRLPFGSSTSRSSRLVSVSPMLAASLLASYSRARRIFTENGEITVLARCVEKMLCGIPVRKIS